MRDKSTTLGSLTALLGTPVTNARGQLRGRLTDIAVATGADAGRVAGLVLKTHDGRQLVLAKDILFTPHGTLELREESTLEQLHGEESFLFLQQDLVDRQIIDVHGRKVVRVNDVNLQWFSHHSIQELRVLEVEVGLCGAVRRLLKGLVPPLALENFSNHFDTRVIPWEFVNVIEVDPARRVKLKIDHEQLARMHPSDIAEILEKLAPQERKAVFVTFDEELAAEALEEAEPRLQQSLISGLDSERVAGIVEEMDPGAAADLLAELPDYRSEAILEEMEPEERHEVQELLEFRENSAAGRMTTDYLQAPLTATVAEAIAALKEFKGDADTVTAIYLTGESGELQGVVPLARIVLALPETRVAVLTEPTTLSCQADASQDEVAELFDKYNLQALPVVNASARLMGVILADNVIAFLRDHR